MTVMTFYFTTLLYLYGFKEPLIVELCAPGPHRQTFAAGLHIGRRQISSFGSQLLYGQGFWGVAVYMRNEHKRPGSCRVGYGLFRRQCARSGASIKTHNASR